ncbi:cyanophycin synthetase [Bdellovibrio sp. 22V]|uniref:cyanophycin synthetase n=1 Tax=Bdellovibrio sp. 22V TaxID=3044166 RepID=UPI0025428AE9|nr:cyanophycin synthetase [Bdellovibrio sp. 22V]WII70737.1 cyanophycin synthetase [Bdellovibrio sp. 22V]
MSEENNAEKMPGIVDPQPWRVLLRVNADNFYEMVKQMKVLNIKVIPGPNVFHSRPVMIMQVDLEDLVDTASNEIPEFNEKLKALLPSLFEHRCSPQKPGGFFERLERGTYMAHIIEHVALELSHLAGMDVTYGKSRYAGRPGVYQIITRFTNERAMAIALRASHALIQSILEKTEFDIPGTIERIRSAVEDSNEGPSTESILRAARRKKIPYKKISGGLIQFGYGKGIRKIQASLTDKTSLIGAELVQDKDVTKEFLRDAGIPVPDGLVIRSEDEINDAMEMLHGPWVLKPFDGHHGNGVAVNLKTKEEMLEAFAAAKKHSDAIIVEEMCEGKDYRILVVDGKFTAASERRPPTVTGDGEKTAQQLIDILNSNPLRGVGHSCVLSKVIIDEGVTATLAKQGLTLESVIPAGQTVLLRGNANLSGGGTAKDVTDEVHPEIRSASERVARLVNLDICGIDVIHSNIQEPINPYFKIIEVNAAPGLRMHLAASEGKSRDVGENIMNMMYPDPKSARIPIIGVTGTNGKTTVVRMIRKIMGAQPRTCVGMTSTEGIWLGKEQILKGDTSGPFSANVILNDPAVDCAVLELARGGILRGGLAYDWSDVGVITNIRPDHIGQDGIDSIEDLVWIKSLVAERVREGGTIVLNADDPHSVGILQSSRIKEIPRKIMLFSLNPNNPLLVAHMASGQDACWLEEGWLFSCRHGKIQVLTKAGDLPITLDGFAKFQVANVLAALCATLALGVFSEDIMRALKEFDPEEENAGRLNIYQVGEGHVILDYGHNSDAIESIGEMLNHWNCTKKTAVFGLPGDRETDLIDLAGHKVAHYFDHIILRDDFDLRGRQPGEVPERLTKLFDSFYPHIKHEAIFNQADAIKKAVSQIQKGEVIVIFFESLSTTLEMLSDFKLTRVSHVALKNNIKPRETSERATMHL